MKQAIVLLDDFYMEFDTGLIVGSLVSLNKNFLIETNKRNFWDFNRYSLELRTDDMVISWFIAYYNDKVHFGEYNPDKEIPIIQIEEGTNREILTIRKK
jgi:hypothetical protein